MDHYSTTPCICPPHLPHLLLIKLERLHLMIHTPIRTAAAAALAFLHEELLVLHVPNMFWVRVGSICAEQRTLWPYRPISLPQHVNEVATCSTNDRSLSVSSNYLQRMPSTPMMSSFMPEVSEHCYTIGGSIKVPLKTLVNILPSSIAPPIRRHSKSPPPGDQLVASSTTWTTN